MNKSNQDTGYLHSVETFGALDGPGIRYVLFLQGCPLRCGFCHNPDTWQACTGKAVTPEDAFEDILKYKNFISSGGVTLSGGEPLLQPEFCQALISLCHSAGIHCAVDTAGSIPLDFCRQAVDAADLLLLDIKMCIRDRVDIGIAEGFSALAVGNPINHIGLILVDGTKA